MWSPLRSILVCQIAQFLAKSYQIGQLMIFFQKVDTLRLLKIYIMFCPPAGAKYPFGARRSQCVLLLNVNRINQIGFFQIYLHHNLPQCYPHNFHMIQFCLCHTQPYMLNHVFDMNIYF